MNPDDKEKLVRNRGMIIRSLDVTTIIGFLVREKAINKKEEATILSDSRRRQRATTLLDILEQKNSTSYQTFLEAIEDHYPHIYLALEDGDYWDEDPVGDEVEAGSPFAPARVDDEWHKIRKCRKYLIKEMDAVKIMSILSSKEIFTQDEEDLIMKTKNPERRTEAFLDAIELKTGTAHESFIETLSEVYPHIFLMLTDDPDEDDDDTDIFDDEPNVEPQDEFAEYGGYANAGEYLGANPGYYKRKNKSCVIS